MSEQQSGSTRRRRHWRGERRAIMVRLPLDVVNQLQSLAVGRNCSLSEAACQLLTSSLQHTREDAA